MSVDAYFERLSLASVWRLAAVEGEKRSQRPVRGCCNDPGEVVTAWSTEQCRCCGRASVAKLCLTFATPWTVACQASLFMGFPRPEYWSGLPFPSPGDLPNPGMERGSPMLQVDSLPVEPPARPIERL